MPSAGIACHILPHSTVHTATCMFQLMQKCTDWTWHSINGHMHNFSSCNCTDLKLAWHSINSHTHCFSSCKRANWTWQSANSICIISLSCNCTDVDMAWHSLNSHVHGFSYSQLHVLGDGLGCLLCQLANASCHPLAQLQLAQKLAHPPQPIASTTAAASGG